MEILRGKDSLPPPERRPHFAVAFGRGRVARFGRWRKKVGPPVVLVPFSAVPRKIFLTLRPKDKAKGKT